MNILVTGGCGCSNRESAKIESDKFESIGPRCPKAYLQPLPLAMNIKILIDAHGAVVIPDVVRQSLGLKEADELILDTFGDTILLRAADSTAVELYSEERIREFAADEAEVGRILSATRNSPDR